MDDRPHPHKTIRLAARGAVLLLLALLCAAPTALAASEVTGAADDLRTGWYPDEPALAPAKVAPERFKQVFEAKLKGQIYAQPLVADGTLLVVTEEDWVYALDPSSGEVRWFKQVGTPVKAEGLSSCADLTPDFGITGTPVIDAERGIAYFVATRYVSGSSGATEWDMYAISLSNGQTVAGFPVKISGAAQNLPSIAFKPESQLQRPALLMLEGVVYAGFGSHCDDFPYRGWMVGVSTSTHEVVSRWVSAEEGGSIWQAGSGPISDGPKQILVTTGNGNPAGPAGYPPAGKGSEPPNGRLAESVVRLAVQEDGSLAAKDFFSPFDNATLDEWDLDVGSSAPLGLPSPYFGSASVPHLLVQDGKEGTLYLLNRDALGGAAQGPEGKDAVVQTVGSEFGGVWDGMAAWPGDGGYVYIPFVSKGKTPSESSNYLRAFAYGGGESPTLSAAGKTTEEIDFGTGSPIVTSDGTASGSALVWISQCKAKSSCEKAELRAYRAVPEEGRLVQVWSAPIGHATKFARPFASGGRVYVANREGDVFAFAGPPEPKEEPQPEPTPSPAPPSGGTVPAGNPPATPSANAATALPALTLHVGSNRRARVTFTLSTAATVLVVVYREVHSHDCRPGVRSCSRWVATKLRLRLHGRAGRNTATLDLRRLARGRYRLTARPVEPSRSLGRGRTVAFVLS